MPEQCKKVLWHGSSQYDYKTDYEDVDYSYDNGKKDESEADAVVTSGKDGDQDYGDFYDYNYEQGTMLKKRF